MTAYRSDLDLEAIKARAEAATPGPWQHGGSTGDPDAPVWVWEETHHAVGDPDAPDTRVCAASLNDAVFIAAAREDVPTLLAEVERLTRERDTFRDRLLERANEEPPSGWLQRGEDGYENTPEGARAERDRAIAERDEAVRALETIARGPDNVDEAEMWSDERIAGAALSRIRAGKVEAVSKPTRCDECGDTVIVVRAGKVGGA